MLTLLILATILEFLATSPEITLLLILLPESTVPRGQLFFGQLCAYHPKVSTRTTPSRQTSQIYQHISQPQPCVEHNPRDVFDEHEQLYLLLET